MLARVFPGRADGTVVAPPSKSVAHRALIAAALAKGKSRITGAGSSKDIIATTAALKALGAHITQQGETLIVDGCDPRAHAATSVDCNESGSTLRFLIPVFALGREETIFTGKGRLPHRPQQVYQQLFAEQGLPFAQTEQGIQLSGPLPAGHYRLRGDVSSQFVTGLLFALPLCEQDSVLEISEPFESRSYVVMTLKILRGFGINAEWQSENLLRIPGKQCYHPQDVTVEGDYSGAAFFGLLGALSGPVHCCGLRADTAQGDAVFFNFLRQFGAEVEAIKDGFAVSPASLTGGTIDLADCPDLGPAAMVLACFAKGETTLQNAARLRLKESDRIAAMEAELRKFGFLIESSENEIIVHGKVGEMPESVPVIDAHNDHRIAMSMAICAAASGMPAEIAGAECVAKSYPEFFDDLRRAGIGVELSV